MQGTCVKITSRYVKITLREILEKTDKEVEGLRLWSSSKRTLIYTGVELQDYFTLLVQLSFNIFLIFVTYLTNCKLK